MDHDNQPSALNSHINSGLNAANHMSYIPAAQDSLPPESCIIRIDKVMHIPGSAFAHLFGRSLWLRISSGNRQLYLDESYVLKPFNNLYFNSYADLSDLEPSAIIDFEIYSWDVMSSWYKIGRTSMSLGDLVSRPSRTLLLQLENGDFMIKKSLNVPTQLHVSVAHSPIGWPKPIESPHHGIDRYSKHVMIITRGTRGDVQPFLALAIGLAEKLNWMVTICTELAYKQFIKSHSKNLARGAIRFRPSGGDTTARVSRDFIKWALHSKSAVIQSMILARSEAEFFSSEPVMFWWADTMKPSAIIYGFTMASIAMIISEKLEIPMLGFVLQPTVIPSTQYPPLESLSQNTIPLMIEDSILSHAFIGTLKSYIDYPTLTALRRRRGLPWTSKPWNHILEQSSPIIVPINEVAFGGRPDDWPESVVMTDFIYLMNNEMDLDPALVKFINDAKSQSFPIVAIGFSSMPIPREEITKIVIRIANMCKTSPRVIAMLGDGISEPISPKAKSVLEQLVRDGVVYECRGAPFGKLFSLVNCVIIHGGLGATSEAMRAGIPVICTGVLLMDQRFWGNRCKAVGIAPEMKHISAFASYCVSQVDEALASENSYASAAKQFAPGIKASDDPTGITINVETVAQLLSDAVPISTVRTQSRTEEAVAG